MSWNFERTIKRIKYLSETVPLFNEINLDRYDYDIAIINGEGTMIMTTPERIDTLMYLLFVYWAKKRGKTVYFVNAMYSDCPKSGRNAHTLSITDKVLRDCDLVSARDPLSYRYLQQNMTLQNCRYIPDALFTWYKYVTSGKVDNSRWFAYFGFETDRNLRGQDLSEGYICISGSSRSAWDQKTAKSAYTDLVKAVKSATTKPILLLQVCSGDNFLQDVARDTDTLFIPMNTAIILGLNILAHAEVYISGRYHPSIMASLGGTYCIFLGANSHKNIGLQEMLEYAAPSEFGAFPSQEDIREICRILADYLGKDNEFVREKIRSTAQRLAEEAQNLLQ